MSSWWKAFENMSPAQDRWLYGGSAVLMLAHAAAQWGIVNTNQSYQNVFAGWYHNSCSNLVSSSQKLVAFQPANIAAIGPALVSLWAASGFSNNFTWSKPDWWRWSIYACMYVVLTIVVLQVIGNADLRSIISLCLSFLLYGLIGYYCEKAICDGFDRVHQAAKQVMHDESRRWQGVRLSLILIYIFQLGYQFGTVCRFPGKNESWSLFLTIWTSLFPFMAWMISWLLINKKTSAFSGNETFIRNYRVQQRIFLIFFVIFFSIHSNAVAFGYGLNP